MPNRRRTSQDSRKRMPKANPSSSRWRRRSPHAGDSRRLRTERRSPPGIARQFARNASFTHRSLLSSIRPDPQSRSGQDLHSRVPHRRCRRCHRHRGSWQTCPQPSGAHWRMRGAGEGNRTLVCSLEDCRSTIELHPRLKSGNHARFRREVNPGSLTRSGAPRPVRSRRPATRGGSRRRRRPG